MDDKLTALAAACERAAQTCKWALGLTSTHGQVASEIEEDIATLRTFAAALRAGRVTVNEGGENG